MKNKGFWIVALFGIAFLIIMYTSTRNLSAHRVEVCMGFRGQQACRTASATTPELAKRTATDNACAFLASGMSDSIACTNTPPTSTRVLEAK